MTKPRVVSLCCGAGLGELGFQVHFRTALAVDSWFRACLSFSANFPNVPVRHADIADQGLITWAKTSLGRIDGVVASPPCQSHSKANSRGLQNLLDDPRGDVYLAPLKWVAALKPEFYVAENVDSIKNSPFLARAIDGLERLGYQATSWVLDAADYGTPQHRARLFLVAMKGRRPPRPPAPTHGVKKGLRPYVTIGEAIGSLSEEEALSMGCESLSATRKWIMEAVGPGQNWRCLTGERLKHALQYGRGVAKNSHYSDGGEKMHFRECARMPLDGVSPTIGAMPLANRLPIHPGKKLDPREFSRYKLEDVARSLTQTPHDNFHQIHPGAKLDYRQFARYSPDDIADTLTVQRDQFKRIHPGIDDRQFSRYADDKPARTLTGKFRQKWDSLHPGRKISSELYARLDDRRSSPTLAAGGPVRQRRVQINPTITRPLSVLEYLRLQGVTGKFALCGPRGDRYRMAGNGISVQLAEAVARAIAETL